MIKIKDKSHKSKRSEDPEPKPRAQRRGSVGDKSEGVNRLKELKGLKKELKFGVQRLPCNPKDYQGEA